MQHLKLSQVLFMYTANMFNSQLEHKKELYFDQLHEYTVIRGGL